MDRWTHGAGWARAIVISWVSGQVDARFAWLKAVLAQVHDFLLRLRRGLGLGHGRSPGSPGESEHRCGSDWGGPIPADKGIPAPWPSGDGAGGELDADRAWCPVNALELGTATTSPRKEYAMRSAHSRQLRHVQGHPVVVETRNPQPPGEESSYPVSVDRLAARRSFADTLRASLSAQGVSQSRLAHLLGISQQRVSSILSGDSPCPAEVLYLLSDGTCEDVLARVRQDRRATSLPRVPTSIVSALTSCAVAAADALVAHESGDMVRLSKAAETLTTAAHRLSESVSREKANAPGVGPRRSIPGSLKRGTRP